MFRYLLLLVGNSVVLQAQDWAAIDRQMAAVQKAVEARDLKAAQTASSELWQLTVAEWSKSHTPADYLREMEARVAANPAGRNSALPLMAGWAVQSGDWEKARNYALDALSSASRVSDSTHAANNVLGLVALHGGDVASAEAYLRAAGKTNGSSTLKRWGPNLALAKALLDKGRKEAVLEYLQDCKSFATENAKLDVWIATLRGGASPDLSREMLWVY
jgi:hypothetical protein